MNKFNLSIHSGAFSHFAKDEHILLVHRLTLVKRNLVIPILALTQRGALAETGALLFVM
ncbi:hypothetical protein V7024_20195 [Bacillus sp. JJ864]|uniref:hypothetical protein n=1 Tax=Bacillus sp. JJ864 TaxID=3122975 RepID=UPI002FFE3470